MRIALGALDLEKAFGTGAAGFVDHDQRLFHQLVLDDDALNQPRHLVGASAGTGRHHELDWLGRLPGRVRWRGHRHHRRRERRSRSQPIPDA